MIRNIWMCVLFCISVNSFFCISAKITKSANVFLVGRVAFQEGWWVRESSRGKKYSQALGPGS
jgi:hypothetical protein